MSAAHHHLRRGSLQRPPKAQNRGDRPSAICTWRSSQRHPNCLSSRTHWAFGRGPHGLRSNHQFRQTRNVVKINRQRQQRHQPLQVSEESRLAEIEIIGRRQYQRRCAGLAAYSANGSDSANEVSVMPTSTGTRSPTVAEARSITSRRSRITQPRRFTRTPEHKQGGRTALNQIVQQPIESLPSNRSRLASGVSTGGIMPVIGRGNFMIGLVIELSLRSEPAGKRGQNPKRSASCRMRGSPALVICMNVPLVRDAAGSREIGVIERS